MEKDWHNRFSQPWLNATSCPGARFSTHGLVGIGWLWLLASSAWKMTIGFLENGWQSAVESSGCYWANDHLRTPYPKRQ